MNTSLYLSEQWNAGGGGRGAETFCQREKESMFYYDRKKNSKN